MKVDLKHGAASPLHDTLCCCVLVVTRLRSPAQLCASIGGQGHIALPNRLFHHGGLAPEHFGSPKYSRQKTTRCRRGSEVLVD